MTVVVAAPAAPVPPAPPAPSGHWQRWWATGAVPARAVDLWFAGTAVPAAATVLGIRVADLLELAERLGLPDRPHQACAPLPPTLLTVWRARHLERLLADGAPAASSTRVTPHRRAVPRPRRPLRSVPAPAGPTEAPASGSPGAAAGWEEAAVLLERTALALQLPPSEPTHRPEAPDDVDHCDDVVQSRPGDRGSREEWLARQVGLALLEHPELAHGLPALDRLLGLPAGRAAQLLALLHQRTGQPLLHLP